MTSFIKLKMGHLADWSTHGPDNSHTSQLMDWTTRGRADAAKRTKTKHAKSPVASASYPVRDLSSTRVDQSARCPVRELAIRELAYPRVVSVVDEQQPDFHVV